ncbi:MAG: hypothetical protein OXT09_16040, partial [Myxococcales bacterium]|nr:hypothetical protein [Myxococcales bacterium]
MRSELRRCRALVLGLSVALAVACSQDDPEDVLDASDMDDPDEMMDASGGEDTGDGDTGDGDAGDGDGDAGDATDAPTGTLHFPMADGARWVYAHTGGNNDWEETVTMVATTHEGEPAILMSDTPGPSMTFSESVLVQDGDVVRRVYKEIILGQLIQSTVTYDPGFARFDEGWVAGGAGHQTTLEYQRVEVDNTDAVLDEQRSHQYDVLAT